MSAFKNLVVSAGGNFRFCGDFLVFVLQLVKLPVDSAFGQQFLVRSHFAQLALVHDDDLVGALNRGETMGDDDGGAAFDHSLQGIANAEFGFGIDTGSGFIEDQDCGVMRQGAGERDELLLSGGKGCAAFAHFLFENRRAGYG